MSTGLGPTDLIAIFSAVFGQITTVRATRKLPAATLHLGQEWLLANESPPRIVVVPTANRYAPARPMGGAAGAPFISQATFNPKTFYRRLTGFDAHLWGDPSPTQGQPDPTEADLWYSYNTTLELERELIVALAQNLGGTAALASDLMSSRWEQLTDMQRLGRELVLSFAFETQVSEEPYVILPYATQSTSGVQVSATVEMVFADGSSSVAGVIVAPP